MHPILLELGPLKLHTYGLMIAVGFLTALFLIQRDAGKAGFDPKVFSDMAFVALPLGIVATRILHIVMFPQYYSWSDPVGWIAVWRGGLVFQGAPPVVLAYIYYYLRKHDVPFLPACDVMFPYVALGHGIGRIGCLMKGCCYGRPTEVAWGIEFPRILDRTGEHIEGSPAFLDHMLRFGDVTSESLHAHAVHPTQLYSFGGLVIVCLILLGLRKYWHPYPGFTLPVYLSLYGVYRFIVEAFRGDHNPVHVFGLSDQQVFSIVFAVLGVVLFVFLQRRNESASA